MTLIKSISGIRGTIGGKPGDALTPVDVVKFASAFAVLVRRRHKGPCKVVVGRDARMSGKMVSSLVCSALSGMGINVIDVGLSTTPTVEMAVTALGAQGGVILTASHNPREWNALKLLNERGEFIDEADGQALLAIVAADAYEFADVDHLGSYTKNHDMLQAHIQKILALPYVDMDLISKRNFRVVIDAINSSGAIAVP